MSVFVDSQNPAEPTDLCSRAELRHYSTSTQPTVVRFGLSAFNTRQFAAISDWRPGRPWVVKQRCPWIGFIHGLDWIGLGRILENVAWIGLDWVRWLLCTKLWRPMFFSETDQDCSM